MITGFLAFSLEHNGHPYLFLLKKTHTSKKHSNRQAGCGEQSFHFPTDRLQTVFRTISCDDFGGGYCQSLCDSGTGKF